MKTTLIIHGIESSNKSKKIKWLKDNLNMQTFIPDLPQHGDNNNEFNIQLILKQIDKIILEMKSSKEKILIGRSFGGYIALLVLKRYPNFFDKICLLSPAINMQETTQTLIDNGYISKDFKIKNSQLIGPKEYAPYDIEIQDTKFETPTLIIQGLKDTITKNGTLGKFLNNKTNFKIRTFETNHNYENCEKEIEQTVKNWILSTKFF